MKVLTITVPSYNAEKYLDKCLTSFKHKAVMDDIEVLIVNDGSSDSTAEIASKYVDAYPSTYRLINKENGGHGSGVNTGIMNATGFYFKVVDADDWVNTDAFVDFVNLLKEKANSDYPEDLIASDFLCIEDGTGNVLRKIKATEVEELYGNRYSFDNWHPDKVIKMHSYTIRTKILKEHYRPLDEHCFYVDSEYITYPMPFVNTVYYDRRELYMYRLGRSGQTMSWEVLARNKNMHLHVLNQLVLFYEEVNDKLSKHKKLYLERCIGDLIDNQFQIYIILGNKKGMIAELRKWDRKMKAEHPRLYTSTSKRSISLIRKTNYWILPFAKIAHSIIKR